jgi:hypothetical protein
VLEELHPAASRTAADSATTTPATRDRLVTRRPVPPRPGDSLLGLIAMPSTTSLPVRFGPATPLRPWPRERYTERSVKKQRRINPADDCAGILWCPGRMRTLTAQRWDVSLYISDAGGCKPLHQAAGVTRHRM